MRLGIDASSLIAQKTGIGSFASHLLEALKAEPGDIEFVELRPKRQADLNTPRRLFWEGLELPRLAKAARVDALYSPGFAPPPDRSLKRIVTVHDVIGLLFPKNVGIVSRFYWSYWLPRNLKGANRIAASSECTKRDLVRLLGMKAEKIEVVPLSVRNIFRAMKEGPKRTVLEHFGVRAPYFISVSTLEPRKNHLRLIKAFTRFKKGHPEHSLVIVGKPAGAETSLQGFIKENGLENSVKMLGYVRDEDLVSLYNGAVGYAMVSLYEGFGLPPLEAMQCGLPGVISNNSSLPEVTGDAAILVAPEDEGAMEKALTALADDSALREKLSAKSLERAKMFSIEKTAEKMKRIFREA